MDTKVLSSHWHRPRARLPNLGRFQEEGIIKLEGKNILVLDWKGPAAEVQKTK